MQASAPCIDARIDRVRKKGFSISREDVVVVLRDWLARLQSDHAAELVKVDFARFVTVHLLQQILEKFEKKMMTSHHEPKAKKGREYAEDDLHQSLVQHPTVLSERIGKLREYLDIKCELELFDHNAL
jgi:hypothetical protein